MRRRSTQAWNAQTREMPISQGTGGVYALPDRGPLSVSRPHNKDVWFLSKSIRHHAQSGKPASRCHRNVVPMGH